MVKKRSESVGLPELLDDDDLEDFWEGMESDISAAQKKAIEILAKPKGRALLTLSDLSDGEIKAIAVLRAIAESIPDPFLISFVENYLALKRSRKREGVKEIVSIVGGRAWKLLQNIHLPRIRREHIAELE